MKEVFISRKLDRWGNKFGFVRFFDVKNVGQLEKEVDKIMIGITKLYVNKPKFGRYDEQRTGPKDLKAMTIRKPENIVVWRKKTNL